MANVKRKSPLEDIRSIAVEARNAYVAHEDICVERWTQNHATLTGIQEDIKKLIAATAKPNANDPWRDYWRSITAGLVVLLLGIGGYFCSNVLSTGQTVIEISDRGKQNRDDIGEMKKDLKDTQAEIGRAHDDILRLEGTLAASHQ